MCSGIRQEEVPPQRSSRCSNRLKNKHKFKSAEGAEKEYVGGMCPPNCRGTWGVGVRKDKRKKGVWSTDLLKIYVMSVHLGVFPLGRRSMIFIRFNR